MSSVAKTALPIGAILAEEESGGENGRMALDTSGTGGMPAGGKVCILLRDEGGHPV